MLNKKIFLRGRKFISSTFFCLSFILSINYAHAENTTTQEISVLHKQGPLTQLLALINELSGWEWRFDNTERLEVIDESFCILENANKRTTLQAIAHLSNSYFINDGPKTLFTRSLDTHLEDNAWAHLLTWNVTLEEEYIGLVQKALKPLLSNPQHTIRYDRFRHRWALITPPNVMAQAEELIAQLEGNNTALFQHSTPASKFPALKERIRASNWFKLLEMLHEKTGISVCFAGPRPQIMATVMLQLRPGNEDEIIRQLENIGIQAYWRENILCCRAMPQDNTNLITAGEHPLQSRQFVAYPSWQFTNQAGLNSFLQDFQLQHAQDDYWLREIYLLHHSSDRKQVIIAADPKSISAFLKGLRQFE